MRFFARIVFICNLCFIAAAILRLVELDKKSAGDTSGVLKYQPLESTLAVLGLGAIFVNLIFFIFILMKTISRKPYHIPKWITAFNLFMLALQVYYYFFT
jgi:hypothetical protein